MKFAGEFMKRMYDQGTKSAGFVEGDLVLLLNPRRKRVSYPSYRAPGKVLIQLWRQSLK